MQGFWTSSRLIWFDLIHILWSDMTPTGDIARNAYQCRHPDHGHLELPQKKGLAQNAEFYGDHRFVDFVIETEENQWFYEFYVWNLCCFCFCLFVCLFFWFVFLLFRQAQERSPGIRPLQPGLTAVCSDSAQVLAVSKAGALRPAALGFEASERKRNPPVASEEKRFKDV